MRGWKKMEEAIEMDDVDVLSRISAHVSDKPNAKQFKAWADSKMGEVHAYTNTAHAVEVAQLPARQRTALLREDAEREDALRAQQEEFEQQERIKNAMWNEEQIA